MADIVKPTQGATGWNTATDQVIDRINSLVSDVVTGTRSSSTYLRGDGTWATPAGGGGGGTDVATWPSPPVNGWLVMPVGTVNNPTRPDAELAVGYQFLPSGTYDALGVQVATAGSTGSTYRFVLYADDGTGRPAALLREVATVASTTGGFKTAVLGSPLVVPASGQIVWAGVVPQGNPTTKPAIWETNTAVVPSIYPSTSTPALQVNNNTSWIASAQTGAAPSTGSGFSQSWGHPRVAFRRSA